MTENFTIIAFGDSTTAVRGNVISYMQRIQDYFEQYYLNNKMTLPNKKLNDWHEHFLNAGVGGNDTELAAQRFDRDVVSKVDSDNTNIIIIQFGVNDSAVDVSQGATAPRVGLNDYARNLTRFARNLKKLNCHVILMTPNPLAWIDRTRIMYGKPPYDPNTDDGFNILLRDYAETARRIARKESTYLVDIDSIFRNQEQQTGLPYKLLLYDGMHPNNAGHAIIAEHLLEVVVPLLLEK